MSAGPTAIRTQPLVKSGEHGRVLLEKWDAVTGTCMSIRVLFRRTLRPMTCYLPKCRNSGQEELRFLKIRRKLRERRSCFDTKDDSLLPRAIPGSGSLGLPFAGGQRIPHAHRVIPGGGD